MLGEGDGMKKHKSPKRCSNFLVRDMYRTYLLQLDMSRMAAVIHDRDHVHYRAICQNIRVTYSEGIRRARDH